MEKSVYIHIPFCIKKCNYCSFVSDSNLELTGIYVDSLIKEINYFYKGQTLDTIYFGGGTPSLLKTNQIERILGALNFSQKTEITLEVNPLTVDFKKLCALKKLGINRISLGVQSFDDDILKKIGRVHNSLDAKNCIKDIKNAGFENFSVDLIYGLPSQTLSNWRQTLNKALKVEPCHISLYGLKIEQGTPFYNNPPKDLPDEDLQADMYEAALEILGDWEHYEFSNFAKHPKFASRHNLTYWKMLPYFGFGLSASGFINNRRYKNECDIKKYLLNPAAPKDFEPYDPQKLLEETIFLGFRKNEGINIDEINKNFGIDFDKKFATVLKKFIETGHIKKTLHGYSLTKNGIMLSNYILSEFID